MAASLPPPPPSDSTSSPHLSDPLEVIGQHETLPVNLNGDLVRQLECLAEDASESGDLVFRSVEDAQPLWAHSALLELVNPELSARISSESEKNRWGRPATVISVTDLRDVKDVVRTAYTSETLKRLQGNTSKRDYTLQLKDETTKAVLATWHVPRFLLALRIPYFARLFSSGFLDSSSDKGSLYTPTFTCESVDLFVAYLYEPVPPTALLDHMHSSSFSNTTFASCPSYKPSPPTPRTAAILKNLLALGGGCLYLDLSILEAWAYASFKTLLHGLQCTGTGCSAFIPYAWKCLAENADLAAQWTWPQEQIPRWLGNPGNMLAMWKKPVIDLPNALLGEVVDIFVDSCKHVSNTAKYWTALDEIDRKSERSKQRDRWRTHLIEPARAACVATAANDLTGIVKSYLRGDFAELSFGELILASTCSGITVKNCSSVYKALVSNANANANVARVRLATIKEAHGQCLAWFRRNWLSLSIAEHPVFEEWEGPLRERLAKELGVDPEDLLGTAGRKPARGRGTGRGRSSVRGSRTSLVVPPK